MSVLLQQKDQFEILRDAAEEGRLTVSEVFMAMRRSSITEDEGLKLLAMLEARSTPAWRRAIVL